MSDTKSEVISVTVEEELKQSYLDYAMSVIIGRALPDVRDGLKPVHRRVLYAMHELSNDWNKPYKKSARIVGDVIGKYHPHGDTAVYDTIVRMAQPFSLRYMLVDGQGNFGSVDGDSPAAMRYTEIRLSRIAHTLMDDLDKETVDFVPNYDESEIAPSVLPTRIPNLLINGSSGIAVGMATNIPPHNLNEVIDATIAMIDQPHLSLAELMKYIPGPDFPTRGMIHGRSGIVEAYKTGRGRIQVRAKTEIEIDEKTNRASIIVTELPYQVNKARLLEKIGELVREKRIEGITALRDESDKDGMRMVIEVRRGDQPEIILNNLFSMTQLQVVFGMNMVALKDGRPQVLSLKNFLEAFLQHRREVITRRTIFELRKARERAHILEGLSVSLANIDSIIALIKAAKTPADAKIALMASGWSQGTVGELLEKSGASLTRPSHLADEYGLKSNEYYLSPEQAQAILDLRLHRLTSLEIEKIHAEYIELIQQIEKLMEIVASTHRLNEVIHTDLLEIKQLFGDERRTEILDDAGEINNEDLINEEMRVVTLSQEGYIKTQSLDSYEAQHRGGRGKTATLVKEQDFVKNLAVAHSHDWILCFSTLGKVYWLKSYQIPQGSRTARGRPIINLLPLEPHEKISALLPTREFDANHFVFMATRLGCVKKVPLSEFANPRTKGKIALELGTEDQLVSVGITNGKKEIMLLTDAGKGIRFSENDVRPMGRTARGVRGIRLRGTDNVIALIIVQPGSSILCATENGYGQRTSVEDYRLMSRGGQGVFSIRVTQRNGKVVAAAQLFDQDEVLLISNQGTMVRTRASEVSVIGRNTQGVRLIQLGEGECLVGIEAVVADRS